MVSYKRVLQTKGKPQCLVTISVCFTELKKKASVTFETFEILSVFVGLA